MRAGAVLSIVVWSLIVTLSAGDAHAIVSFSAAAPITLHHPPGDGLQAIAAADLNHDGKADIVVVHPDAGLVSVFLNDGVAGFTSSPISVGTGTASLPVAVITADFNQDGNVDLAVVNHAADSVTVFLGDGTGHFSTGGDYSVDAGPIAAVAADFDHDSREDLAVLSDSSIFLLKGHGDGTLSPFAPASLNTRGRGALAIAAGRIKSSHGYTDLAVTNQDTDSVSLFFNNGDGTFQQPPILVSALDHPRGLVIGEFDGNTSPDLAVISGVDVSTTVIILAGDGQGGFTANDTATAVVSAEVGAVALTAVDLDGDGKTDLAVGSDDADFGVGLVQLFCQQPSVVCSYAGFSANPIAANFQIQQATGALVGSVSAVQSGDLNGDGRPDLVAVEVDTPAIKILLNTTGQLLATPTPTVTPTPSIVPTLPFVCVGDCDGHGSVTINEILEMVEIALGNAVLTLCPAGDADGNGQISVDEVLKAVSNALDDCSSGSSRRSD